MKHTIILLTVLSSCALFSCQSSEAEDAPPNIIVFLVDDMGWQDTSVPFWNQRTPFNDLYQTPNMERLAREGMKFTQAYAASVCSPTRVSLMSGMNAARHRVTNWTLRRNGSNDRPHEILAFPEWHVNGLQPVDTIGQSTHITPLPQILKDNGYVTIHCGKAHFGAIGTPGADPLNVGFDVNIAGHAAGGPGSYLGGNNFSADWRSGDRVWDVPGLEKYHGQDIFLTEALTREAIDAVKTARKQELPFYLYMSHYAVHTPLEVDSRFYSKYKQMGLEEPEARYAAMVEGMDKSLGDLMKFLDEEGLTDNTIILFMSDNGGLSAVARGGQAHTHNKPLSSGKGSAHEGGIREPMLVKWPGVVEPGSVCNEYLIIEDFFPTILEMAEVADYQTVQPIDGLSFTPLLQGEAFSSRDRPLFWHFPNNWGPVGPGIGASSAIRLGDWKLIYYHERRNFELFNLKEDIGEQHNLADSRPDKVYELAQRLSEYLASVDAQMPTDKRTGALVELPGAVVKEPALIN
jgi:arylsulfatase A-like enzyme